MSKIPREATLVVHKKPYGRSQPKRLIACRYPCQIYRCSQQLNRLFAWRRHGQIDCRFPPNRDGWSCASLACFLAWVCVPHPSSGLSRPSAWKPNRPPFAFRLVTRLSHLRRQIRPGPWIASKPAERLWPGLFPGWIASLSAVVKPAGLPF